MPPPLPSKPPPAFSQAQAPGNAGPPKRPEHFPPLPPIPTSQPPFKQQPPSSRQFPPSHGQAPPSSRQVPPSSRQVPHSSREVPPSSRQAPPSSRQVPPSSRQAPPSSRQAPPSSRQAPPSSRQVPHSSREVPPSSRQVPPSSRQVPPSSRQAPPSSRQAPPSSRQVQPSSRSAPSGGQARNISQPQPKPTWQHQPHLFPISSLPSPPNRPPPIPGQHQPPLPPPPLRLPPAPQRPLPPIPAHPTVNIPPAAQRPQPPIPPQPALNIPPAAQRPQPPIKPHPTRPQPPVPLPKPTFSTFGAGANGAPASKWAPVQVGEPDNQRAVQRSAPQLPPPVFAQHEDAGQTAKVSRFPRPPRLDLPQSPADDLESVVQHPSIRVADGQPDPNNGRPPNDSIGGRPNPNIGRPLPPIPGENRDNLAPPAFSHRANGARHPAPLAPALPPEPSTPTSPSYLAPFIPSTSTPTPSPPYVPSPPSPIPYKYRPHTIIRSNSEVDRQFKEMQLILPNDPYVGSGNVRTLNEDNYRELVEKKDLAMVLFYNPEEDHSWAALEYFRKAADTTKNREHQFAAVDCDDLPDFCAKHDVRTPPAYKIFSRGKLISTIRETTRFNEQDVLKYMESISSMTKGPTSEDSVAPELPEKKQTKCTIARVFGFKK